MNNKKGTEDMDICKAVLITLIGIAVILIAIWRLISPDKKRNFKMTWKKRDQEKEK